MSDKVPVEVRRDFNLSDIKHNIELIKIHIEELKLQGVTDQVQIEMSISDLFSDFYDNYMSIVKRICRGDDMSYLNVMFKALEKVQKGEKSLASTELELGKQLASTHYNTCLTCGAKFKISEQSKHMCHNS